jgi:hypothetical protein
LADRDFEVISDPENIAEAKEQEYWQNRLDDLIGRLPFDRKLAHVQFAMELGTLEKEEFRRLGQNGRPCI